jgi:hypothetical protein
MQVVRKKELNWSLSIYEREDVVIYILYTPTSGSIVSSSCVACVMPAEVRRYACQEVGKHACGLSLDRNSNQYRGIGVDEGITSRDFPLSPSR